MIRPNITKVLNHHAVAMKQQQRATQIVTTGKRLNKAADDSAAVGMTKTMLSKASSLEVAKRNIDEGIRAATMADEGITGVVDSLTRLRELAIQSASGTYSDLDRQNIQAEFSALVDDIEQQALRVTYNDVPLLTSSNLNYITDAEHDLTGLPPGAFVFGANQGPANVGGRDAWVQEDSNSQLWVPIPSPTENNFKVTVDVFLPSADNASAKLRPFAEPIGLGPGIASFVEIRQASRSFDEVVVTERGGSNFYNESSTLIQDAWATMTMEINQSTGEFTAKLDGQELVSDTFSLSNLSGDQILLQGEAFGSPNVAWSNLKIESAPDSDFDIEDGINIQAGDELIDAVKLKISAKALPEDLGLSSSSITSISEALSSIEKIDSALESLYLQRSEIGASTRRLISEQTSVLNEHLQLRSSASEIEDGDMAKASSDMATGQLHSDLNMKVMKEMFQIDRLRIVRLLEQKIAT